MPRVFPSPSRFRVWSPPGSRLRIEYSNALLRQVYAEAGESDVAGVLFGERRNGLVRLLVARRDLADRPSGLQPVGIFAARPRGEVFLTESDLRRFENVDAKTRVALVVAGTRAGFFVHEPDGSIQSIQSHREFSITARATNARPWIWPALAIVALAMAALSSWPRKPPGLTVQENGGQVRIQWNPAVRAKLEIRDGAGLTSVPVSAPFSSATYVPRTGEVLVRLGSETARFAGPAPVAKVETAPDDTPRLKGELLQLRGIDAAQRRRIAELRKILSTMVLDH